MDRKVTPYLISMRIFFPICRNIIHCYVSSKMYRNFCFPSGVAGFWNLVSQPHRVYGHVRVSELHNAQDSDSYANDLYIFLFFLCLLFQGFRSDANEFSDFFVVLISFLFFPSIVPKYMSFFEPLTSVFVRDFTSRSTSKLTLILSSSHFPAPLLNRFSPSTLFLIL